MSIESGEAIVPAMSSELTEATESDTLAGQGGGKVSSLSEELRPVGYAAEKFQVSTGTVRNWIAKGYVKAVSLPSGVRRIPESEINRLVTEIFALPKPVVLGTSEVEVEVDEEPTQFVSGASPVN